MNNTIKLLMFSTLISASFSAPAFAQGAPQTVSLMTVDLQSLTTGYRATKMIGSTVVNENNEVVGKIDDLIITPSDKVPFAVLSVGGFLGVGTKYVVVPSNSLEVNDNRMLLRGATKESLKVLPSYKYSM